MTPGMEPLLASLRHVCPSFTGAELSLFSSKVTPKSLNKKAFFLEAGHIQKALGFLASGLVRSFYVGPEGNDRTVGFYAEGDYATHYASFIARKPSSYTIQCLEPSTFLCITFDDLQWLYRQSANFERYGRLITEDILKRQQTRIESFVFRTAEERYLDFTRDHASLFNRISLSQLCSYLGIERQTLTRIRQKIAHR